MQITDIWPLLLPGALFQTWMQICYIVEEAKESKRKPFNRTMYILSIAFFGLAAIAFHLLRKKKELPKDNTTEEVEKANRLTNKGIFYLLLIPYQVMGLHLLAENTNTSTYISLIWLLAISFLIMILYNLLSEIKSFIIDPLLPMLQILLCIPIQYLDVSGDNLFISIIAGFSAINFASLSRAKVYGIGAFGTYLLGSTIRTIFLFESYELVELVRYFFVNAIVVLLALLAFYTLKKQMIISVKLESALGTVKEQSEKLKELAIIEERNRIAAEMHDTVGHTLTAAVLTLEAVEEYTLDPEAIQKMDQGKELVRRGLFELRESVKVVREGKETNFIAVLNHLLQEIQSDTGLDINLIVTSKINISLPQAGILLSAIKECTTNAIKHGQATHLDILIDEHDGQIHVTLTNNGSHTEDIKSGCGLAIMEERIKSIGGTMATESAPGEGFTLSLMIPTTSRKDDV